MKDFSSLMNCIVEAIIMMLYMLIICLPIWLYLMMEYR